MTMAALKNEPVATERTIDSDVLGPIRVPGDRLVRFPDGLLGFPEAREFALVASARDGAFWLQSTEHASLIFFLVDPFLHFPDYAVDLSDADAAALEARDQGDVAILSIVTLPAGPEQLPTANLQGPVAVNLAASLGRQVIVRNLDAGIRRTLPLQ